MKYFCCEPRRLEVVKLTGSLNGIAFLEVRDHLEPDPVLRQRTLFVRLLRLGFAIGRDNVAIEGGARIESVDVEWAATADNLPAGVPAALVAGIDDLPRTLVVRTKASGDFSRYTLRLRSAPAADDPPPGFDPRLASIGFSFKVECPSDFDCAGSASCPPAIAKAPEIDYLAKDYTGFRRMMLDRLNLLCPGWTERSAADVGVALVELMAYAADNLSYRQDAIAREAYLSTARRRESVRRHARLVDYRLHDGCNARAWVRFVVGTDAVLPRRTRLLTRGRTDRTEIVPGSREERDALEGGALVFETAAPAQLRVGLNKLSFHTWGDLGCCLPRGALKATLRGALADLRVNDVLIFEEVLSPTTFVMEDADRAHRWAVRLTGVRISQDPCGQLFDPLPVDAPLAVTEIEWDAADAIPFPICISVRERPGLEIGVAYGNVVLADHGDGTVDGRVRQETVVPAVPPARLEHVSRPRGPGECAPAVRKPIPTRFRPWLVDAPVTQGFDLEADLAVAPADEDHWFSATTMMWRDPREALPSRCELRELSTPGAPPWTPRRDLLASSASDPHFVVELQDDGLARLRFGDDQHGKRPNSGTSFEARYRLGCGTAGNVGADTIAHVVAPTTGVILKVINPMPAAGGIEPEDVEAARRDAPEAFRTQERAVTAADYAAAAQRRPEVQRAAARFRWTGSWHTVFVAADRRGGESVDAPFEARLRRHLERFRMAGYDLEVDAPRFVALDVELHVCTRPGHVRSDVARAVTAVLGAGVLPDGRRAAFHPDNFSFGEPVYLSRILAAAQAVEGVQSVWARKFERLGSPDPAALENGVIAMGGMEIAQLANDPNFRERGRLTLAVGGGR